MKSHGPNIYGTCFLRKWRELTLLKDKLNSKNHEGLNPDPLEHEWYECTALTGAINMP